MSTRVHVHVRVTVFQNFRVHVHVHVTVFQKFRVHVRATGIEKSVSMSTSRFSKMIALLCEIILMLVYNAVGYLRFVNYKNEKASVRQNALQVRRMVEWGPKWTVIWAKWTVTDDSGWSESIKLDGPEVWNWTVQKYEHGRSRSMKVDGPGVWKWMVQRYSILKRRKMLGFKNEKTVLT